MFNKVIVRGGGDLATGVIQKLHRAGFSVIVLECERPTAIRQLVCLSQCVYNKTSKVEDIEAVFVNNISEIETVLSSGKVPVIIDPNGNLIDEISPICVVDAIIAKKNLGTTINMANITIALGPGFIAGKDVHCVIETKRGHDLGRLILNGSAVKNTGEPGSINGFTKERVIYSPTKGIFISSRKIKDIVKKGDIIGTVSETYVVAKLDGVLRGLIPDNFLVKENMKIGDIDPRQNEVKNCDTISDKARCLGGAVLEAILYFQNKNQLVNRTLS